MLSEYYPLQYFGPKTPMFKSNIINQKQFNQPKLYTPVTICIIFMFPLFVSFKRDRYMSIPRTL